MAKQTIPPYELLVLTNEYLIDGIAPGDSDIYVPKADEYGGKIQLTNVKIQSTGQNPPPASTCARYVLACKAVLAYVPRTDYTQLSYYPSWKLLKTPLNGVFYLGPYRVTGRMMTMNGSLMMADMPMFDVRIESVAPGTQWGALNAPFAVINAYQLHGWEPY